MKLPAAALAGIEDMVSSFLPYEDNYQSQTKQSSIIDIIYQQLADSDLKYEKWRGFVFHIMKKIDDSEKLQKDVDDIVLNLKTELDNYDEK